MFGQRQVGRLAKRRLLAGAGRIALYDVAAESKDLGSLAEADAFAEERAGQLRPHPVSASGACT